ncbi:MAG: phosphate ABC transporter permease subunit PstC [Candidatus Margulisbacteria bacterium]|nr:phosphate ABC transporter permease subunit PstC [Candidatus Margulisiibacteriota bacterium]
MELRINKNKAFDELTNWVFKLSSSISILVVVGIFIFLFKESLPFFKEMRPADLFLSAKWNPEGWSGEYYGILALVWGSLLVTVITLVISIPLGLMVAVFIAEIAPRNLKIFIKPVIELLAGIPSVVIGFFGLVFVGPLIAGIFHLANGLNALNGGLLLSIMVLPTIITLSEDAINGVPKDYREASFALGATKLETIFKVTLPAASSGILAAIMLGMGRAIGETMAVLMACGNAPALAKSIFDPVRTLTSTIAIEMGEVAYDTNHYYALFNLGLYLFLISFFINNIAEYFLKKGRRNA